MQCNLFDLKYGDKFRFSQHGYLYVVVDVRGIPEIHDYFNFQYVIDIPTGSMERYNIYDKAIIVWKEA